LDYEEKMTKDTIHTEHKKFEFEERLRIHTRKIPCLSCIARITCCEIFKNGDLKIKEPCEEWKNWQKGRDKIAKDWTSSESNRIISSTILDTVEEERKNQDGTTFEHQIRT
jgi:hypothetical protein